MDLKDHFLISLPRQTSHQFSKSVVYIADHDDVTGSNGWIVNKQIEDGIAQNLRTSMGLTKHLPLYFGGPVNTNSAVILHSADLHLPDTIKLNDELSMTRNRRVINLFNTGNFPNYWKIIIGMSNWSPTQLTSEFALTGNSAWTSTSYTDELMWGTSPKDQWNVGINSSVIEQIDTLLASTFID
tara:strand:- start:9828 stop:10379 length:552 start_codon:yes stop_codon:yes gene_type:complete